MKKIISLLLLSSAASAFASPAVGPDYHRPAAPDASSYRDSPADGSAWKTAAPADAFARGEWWKLFADPVLDGLETRALAANQDLHAAAARVQESRAAAGLARSAYFPNLALDPSMSRERTSTTIANTFPVQESTTYRGALDAAWEIDLFGRVRRLTESARADAAASASAFAAVRLALSADVATHYFSLRALDDEQRFVAGGVDLRQRALDLVSAQRKSGAATDFDVARAETELASTTAESAALANRRSAVQSALAVLLGEPAPNFSLGATTSALAVNLLGVPAGLPSALLERRPDIAGAERAMVAANARIGVAKSAFFPAITLTGSAGFASRDVDRLAHADSRIWSIGPSLYLPIFQGGRNRANLERSRAAYDETVATYRQQVLVAFREVQDSLTATRLLAEQADAQDRALASARRAGGLAQTRYDAGYVNFFEVIDAQRTVLATERASAQLTAQRLTNTVALIKALGGGWTTQSDWVATR